MERDELIALFDSVDAVMIGVDKQCSVFVPIDRRLFLARLQNPDYKIPVANFKLVRVFPSGAQWLSSRAFLCYDEGDDSK